MEVEKIFTSCIKPSPPLPPQLQTYKLSRLDQFSTPIYWNTILFYPTNSQETTKRSQLLKQSLSETLSRFYPYAGKVKDNASIDCSDAGVCYINAQCNISLSQFLTRPDEASINKLLPDSTLVEQSSGSPVALIQETTFSCGGFSIGMHVSHLVSDVHSQALFLKEWAATTRKVAVRHPFLGVESIFPQWNTVPPPVTVANVCGRFAKTGNFTAKRIVFKESAIANLKAKASSNNINNPSRSKVVIAFLVKCLMKTYKNKTGNDQPLAMMIPVNLRTKGDLALLEYSLGNVVSLTGTVLRLTEKEKELIEIVNQVTETVGKVDNEFMKKIQSDVDELFKHYDTVKEIMDSHDASEFVVSSSLCNFGIYDIDFSWGKPIWAVFFLPFQHNPDQPSFNSMILMDTRTGRGVEAWLSLLQEDMDILEKDTQLLQYASIDPSPLYNSFELASKL